MSEKNTINGAVQMEDYGTLSNGRKSEDKMKLVDNDGFKETSSSVNNQGNYFRDGKRRIDFVLVWEEEIANVGDKKTPPVNESASARKARAIENRKAKWRIKFLANLQRAGLELEEEDVEGDERITHYIKLFLPWDIMCAYAEDMLMRAPLQAHPNPTNNASDRFFQVLRMPNPMKTEFPYVPLDYYTCPFRRSKLDRFLGSDNHDKYFNVTQRHQAANEILQTTVYGKKKRAEVGIERLLDEEVFTAAYPLHDGPCDLPKGDYDPRTLNSRQQLWSYWAKWGRWYKYQPLDHIREYFGEKIGIYFAWLGFYTAWLFPASLVGVLVFAYGVVTFHTNVIGIETCNETNQFKMCPLCDENIGCKYWNLSDVCKFAKISYLFDHPGTVFYAVFMSFWAVTFLEYWKRKTASLAHHWDVMDFEEEEERPRPQYASLAPTMEKNPITGVIEPHFPERDRIPRILSGIACVIVMMILVLIFILAVIMYRVLISIPLFQNKQFRANANTIASGSSAVVNLILIMSLGKVYEKLALKLTQWEMHRTQTEFEDQLTFKVFLFQFVNFYSSIFYVGFFKGKFVGYPGHYDHFFGLRNEECQNGGCLIELAQQLAVIMIGKQIINNCQEVVVPKLKTWLHQRKINKTADSVANDRWEDDYELIDYEGLFEEYLEMVLQFGFITIFVAAFPLAPLFALLNNWLEIRLDASKLVCETRRPVAERAQDIGVWFVILDGLAQLSVISNAFLIAFTSEFLPKMIYQYRYEWDLKGYVNFTLATSPQGSLKESCRYKAFRDENGVNTMFYWNLMAVRLGFVILFEHCVFGVMRLIDILVPDVPETLEIKIKRERFLAKQALADNDTMMILDRRGLQKGDFRPNSTDRRFDDEDEGQDVVVNVETKA